MSHHFLGRKGNVAWGGRGGYNASKMQRGKETVAVNPEGHSVMGEQ